jgi:hypothetical protein
MEFVSRPYLQLPLLTTKVSLCISVNHAKILFVLSVPFELDSYLLPLTIILAAFVSLFLLFVLIVIVYHRQSAIVKTSTAVFSYLIIFACTSLGLSVMPYNYWQV